MSRRSMLTHALRSLVIFGMAGTVPAVQAEVAFPPTRSSVDVGEFYELDVFADWTVYCLRDAQSEDHCEATTFVSDHAAGVRLEFSVAPIIDFTEPLQVTVDVSPRAIVAIEAASAASHYRDLSAAIVSLDGVPFDGYACPITNLDACARGPELVLQDVRTLNSAEVALIEITRLSNDDLITAIEVPLAGLYQAYQRANAFTAEIHGFDLTDTRNLGEMCNFVNDGVERRISYFLDPEADFSRPSRRESWLGPTGSTTCPSYVILAYFTPDMTPAQRNLFCLVFDAERREYLGADRGEADHYGVCRRPTRTVCERVNDSRDVALATVAAAAALTGGTSTVITTTGVSVVTHSSGAAILTGSAGYIANTIGPLAASVGLLSAPLTLGLAAVSVVGVGGALYVCREA